MPAGFTHMTLARKAVDGLAPADQKAKLLLKKQVGAYINGSVGPDIPYMAPFDDLNVLDNHDHVADKIHAHHTMEIPYSGIRLAKQRFEEGKKEEAEEIYAYFLGYLSHVVLDGFTHPFIRDRVGDYGPKTKVHHRDLEMKIDVLVLDHFVNIEANGVNPQEDLTLFHDCNYQDKIFQAYSRFLKTYHQKELPAEKLRKLSDGMINALNIAEGQFPRWYRLLAKDRGLAYMNLDEVKKEEYEVRTLKKAVDADEKGISYNSIGDKDVDIFDDVFPKYLKFFPGVISGTYNFTFENGSVLEDLVPAINLDTGRALASLSLKDRPALWDLV